MSGFVSALIGEWLTGKGALGQLQLGECMCIGRVRACRACQQYACLGVEFVRCGVTPSEYS